MSECNCSCNCGSDRKNVLIYSCSGAANTGELADRAVRELSKSGIGKMTCLAALGAELAGFVESAKGADDNIVIDGCPVACGKKTFERLGIENYQSFILTDFGVKKGETPITPELVEKISTNLSEILQSQKECL